MLRKTFLALFLFITVISAQGRFGVSIQGCGSIPFGVFGDFYKTGFGGTGTITFRLSSNIDLTASLGYTKYNNKNLDDSYTAYIIPAAGIRYFLTEGTLQPYLTVNVGGFFRNTQTVNILPAYIKIETSTADLGFTGGAGFIYNLNNFVKIDITGTACSAGDSFLNLSAGLHVSI